MVRLSSSTRILLADGTNKSLEDLVVGETVLGPDGLPRMITKLQTDSKPIAVYRVDQELGDSYHISTPRILFSATTGYYCDQDWDPRDVPQDPFIAGVGQDPKLNDVFITNCRMVRLLFLLGRAYSFQKRVDIPSLSPEFRAVSNTPENISLIKGLGLVGTVVNNIAYFNPGTTQAGGTSHTRIWVQPDGMMKCTDIEVNRDGMFVLSDHTIIRNVLK